MQACGEVEVYLHVYLTSALDGSELPRPVYAWENSPHGDLVRGLVGPRTGLDAVDGRKTFCPYQVDPFHSLVAITVELCLLTNGSVIVPLK
jgi:hypothetical protein